MDQKSSLLNLLTFPGGIREHMLLITYITYIMKRREEIP